ncbi:MAG: EAL domain-containing protein [Actinobacteria bacterium]|nr:EAL domain-containing protein [Actinomycetota bacterium]
MARPRPPSANALIDSWRDDLWQRAIRLRITSIAGLAVFALVLPDIGPNRALIAGSVLVIGLAYNIVLNRLYARHGRIPEVLAVGDVVLPVVFPLQAHSTYLPAVLLLVANLALIAALFRRRTTYLASAGAMAGVAVVSLVAKPDLAQVMVPTFAVCTALAVATVNAVAGAERRVRARYRDLLESLDGIVWESDPAASSFSYVGPRAEEILGWPLAAWLQEGFWAAHVHADDRDRAVAEHQAAVGAGRSHELEYRMVRPDGGVVHLQDVVTVTPTRGGAITRGVMVDVSERKRTEERVRQYADIFETVELGLVVLRLADRDDDESLEIVAANAEAARIMNRPLHTWTGRRLIGVLPLVEDLRLHHRLATVARDHTSFAIDEVVLRPGQDNEQIAAVKAFALPGDSVCVSLQDVTNEVTASRRLRRQALYDGLTGLPNRTLMRDHVGRALASAARAESKVALLVMDLDQFKEVNDTLGHHIGDRLLTELGGRLQDVLRDADLVARLGGDEFAVLLTTDVSEEGAEIVAHRIRAALLEPFTLDQLRLQTNASIGIALFPDHADDASELTQRADVAMYQAKRSASGHAVYRADLDHSSVRRLTLLSELRHGLEAGQFRVEYQPLLALPSRVPVRVEALVRWDHPQHGTMLPAEFIELAELSGFVRPLTHWVLSHAIAEAARWWQAGTPVGLAVNLSVRNLYDPDLPTLLGDLLALHPLPPSELTLEVTETQLMDDPSLALEVLGAISRLGVATAVDDFGTGYSSLTYLRNLPVRELKIDRSFVSGVARRTDDLVIVRSIVDLGHNLGLDVVAEGVEDDATIEVLEGLGCDLAQGFVIAQPLGLGDLIGWLDAHPGMPLTDVSGEPTRR